jgi:hypothetical protein
MAQVQEQQQQGEGSRKKQERFNDLLRRAYEVAGTIESRDRRAEALSALGAALAQAQQKEQAQAVWAEAERVIGTIPESDRRVEALRALGAALIHSNKDVQLLRLVQHSWQQADTRDYAVALLSLVNDLLPLKPEIGTKLCESFSWVDDFLKG